MARSHDRSPIHLRTGAALGYEGEVDETVLRCDCGTLQTEVLDSWTSAKKAIAGVTCLFCGRVGTMRIAKLADTKGAA